MFWPRFISAMTVIAVVALALTLDFRVNTDVGFTIIFGIFVVLTTKEMFDMARQKGLTPFAKLGTATVAAFVLAQWIDHRYPQEICWEYIVAFCFLLGLFFCQGFLRTRRAGVTSMSLTVFTVFYIWVLGGFIQRMNYIPGIALRGVIVFLLTVKAADVGAYAVGSRIGKHHPFPRLSPAKTLEGYIGGLLLALIVSLGFGLAILRTIPWYQWLAFAVLMWFFGGLGDLFESVIKRDLGAKDSASLLPGLGGVFDQFDSLLLAGPAAYLMLSKLAA